MANKKIITYVPVVIVMLISVAALVPGVLQNGVSERLDSNRELLTDLQDSFEYLSGIAQYVFQFDSNLYGSIWEQFAEAKRLDIELTTLGANATALQNMTYANLMIDHLMNAHIMADQTYSFHVYVTFTSEPTRTEFHLGISSSGYALDITREDYEENPTYLMTTVEDFLTNIYSEWYAEPGQEFFLEHTMEILRANFSDVLAQPYGVMYAEDTLYTLDPRCNMYNLTYSPIFEMNLDIFETEDFVNQDEQSDAVRCTGVSVWSARSASECRD